MRHDVKFMDQRSKRLFSSQILKQANMYASHHHTHTHTHTNKLIDKHSYMYKYTHINIYIRTNTYTHKYIHTYIHTWIQVGCGEEDTQRGLYTSSRSFLASPRRSQSWRNLTYSNRASERYVYAVHGDSGTYEPVPRTCTCDTNQVCRVT
jgi:hypothetical protein